MAEKDLATKYLEDYNDVFADIVNVLLYHGEKIIQEEQLNLFTSDFRIVADWIIALNSLTTFRKEHKLL